MKTLKQDKCVYKMPIYEPLQKGPGGVEKTLRIPELISTSVDPDFMDKAKKVGYFPLYITLFSPTSYLTTCWGYYRGGGRDVQVSHHMFVT